MVPYLFLQSLILLICLVHNSDHNVRIDKILVYETLGKVLDHCPVNAILREDFIYQFFLNILIVLTIKSGLSKINTFEWKACDKQCVPLKKVWFNTVITGLFHKNYTNMQFFCQSTQAVVVVFHSLAQSSLLKSFFFNLIFFSFFSQKTKQSPFTVLILILMECQSSSLVGPMERWRYSV